MRKKQTILQLLVTPPNDHRNEPVPFQDSVSRNKLFLRILECLEGMPESMRRVFVLRHYQGVSLFELAEQTGMLEPDLASLLRSADHRLQQALRPFRGRWDEEKKRKSPDYEWATSL